MQNRAVLLQPILAQAVGLTPSEKVSLRPVGGGSINESYQVSTKDNKQWFVKFNQGGQKGDRFPKLFEKEARGLESLSRLGPIRTPAVLACTEIGDQQVLILEWITEGLRTNAFWRLFGETLAQLHRVTSDQYGWEEDNYMGALPQLNSFLATWPAFFVKCRLEPQVKLAFDHGRLNLASVRQFERLYSVLPDFFDNEPPALVHGDLWSGNFCCDTAGRPVLIDPAVHFGHRSVDLGMTTLFGGFEKMFYDAYAYHYPLPDNFRAQWAIANLYPLLIHLNLFGGTYGSQITRTLETFLGS